MSPKSPLPPFMRKMNPDKFKAMSKAEQAAYRKKTDIWFEKEGAKIDRQNAEAHKKLVFGIAKLIQEDVSVEWAIVHNYLQRTGQCQVDRAFMDQPSISSALAKYDLEKQSRRGKTSKKA